MYTKKTENLIYYFLRSKRKRIGLDLYLLNNGKILGWTS